MYIYCIFLLFINYSFAQSFCNGYSELCNKRYNDLTYILNHNAYGYIANPAANQLCPITTQLTDGVRGLKLSALKANPNASNTTGSEIMLCHSSCSILDAGPAIDALKNITEWLHNNPNEVITIMWNNLGSFEPAAFKEAYDAAGLSNFSYHQSFGDYSWPTLSELIQSGKRVINFVDEGANVNKVEWLLPEWSFVFETPYDNRNATSFRCTMDRPIVIDSPTEYMYVMNHFVYGVIPLGSLVIEIPQRGMAGAINSQDSLLKQAQTCTRTFGRQPNFLELDFFNLGQSLEIAAQLNNVSYTQTQLQCDIFAANNNNSSSSTTQASAATLHSSNTMYYYSTAILFVFLHLIN